MSSFQQPFTPVVCCAGPFTARQINEEKAAGAEGFIGISSIPHPIALHHGDLQHSMTSRRSEVGSCGFGGSRHIAAGQQTHNLKHK